MWSVTEEQTNTYTAGKVVEVTGAVSEFRGKPQLNIQVLDVVDETEVDLSDFLETAPVEADSLKNEIMQTIETMDNEKIKNITKAIIEKHEKDFFAYPAGRSMHHAYVGGLAYHTRSMLEIAKGLVSVYPELNEPLLYAGVILHDVAKVTEYEKDGVSFDIGLEGKLKGHLVMISEEIAFTAKELGIEGEEVMLLQHMVGSHHGRVDQGWGSFTSAILMEAEILHFIDMIDSKMDMLKSALGKKNKGEFTERLFGLDNRSFYKPTI